MIKYKLREERIGASLFNNLIGTTKILSEKEYKDSLNKDSKEFSYLYDKEEPLFKLYRPVSNRTKLPEDCLSTPSKVYFELTRKCNLHCRNCYNKSNSPLNYELSTEKIMKLIKRLSDIGVFELRLTGGEPTIHPDFFKIVDYAKKLDFFLSLGSNGVWDESTRKKILCSGINIVIISIDGPKEINDKIRGKGSFEKAVESISNISKNKDIYLKINMTLGKYNKNNIEYVVSLADSLGVKVVNLGLIKLTGRAIDRLPVVLSKKDTYEVIKQVTILRKKYNVKIQTYFDILDEKFCWLDSKSTLVNKKNCGAGIEVSVINPKGEVYGCAVSPASELIESPEKDLFMSGNIEENDFLKIWHDSKKWKIHRNLKLNKSEKCISCKHYNNTCFGNCVIASYSSSRQLNSEDPYCFVDLIVSPILNTDISNY